MISAISSGYLNGHNYPHFLATWLVIGDADKEAKDTDGWTALIRAARSGQLDVVRYLVDAGADKEAKSTSGSTSLLSVAHNGHLDVVQYLGDQGADASWYDNEENSALIYLLLRDDGKDDTLRKFAKSIALKKPFPQISVLFEKDAAKPRRTAIMRREPEGEDPNWLISSGKVARRPIPLAVGGFGKVYRARWSHNDVVLKEIAVESEEQMRRFRREVEIWYNLRHSNIVLLHGANDRAEPCFIVSAFATNGELISYLKCEKYQGRNVVWRKLGEVAAGLSYLHGKGVVHCDLKGNNIVVSKDGTAMLGMCFIEAATCKTPWSGYTNDEIRGCLRRGEIKVEQPAELTDEQWELVSRMIAKSCDDRPGMPEVLRALEEFALDEEMAESSGS
ncbi:hypothetical protein BBJ28_00025259 [Nothophytophthora sp. Chile5]|nr:hypothetical protein BBJ28_00025259 [Nothophytophthora sp. Chile5]